MDANHAIEELARAVAISHRLANRSHRKCEEELDSLRSRMARVREYGLGARPRNPTEILHCIEDKSTWH